MTQHLAPANRTMACRLPSLVLACFSMCVTATAAAELVCEGILGNSGVSDATLVRFAPEPARGLGVAYDRFGSLWDRGGARQLNRYAMDGRLLATYPLPPVSGRQDRIALVGDTLVVQLSDRLFTLPVTAPAGTEPQLLQMEAASISFGAPGGRLAVAHEGQVLWLDPNNERTEVAIAGPLENLSDVEAAPDGTLYVRAGGRVHRFVDGSEDTSGWPKQFAGECMQRLGDSWFAHRWHGTVLRYDLQLQPAPGVVLGGASGRFIGFLPQNSDLTNGRGMAWLNNGIYAISGMEGIVQLLRFDTITNRMTIVRRIGALPQCDTLALDHDGNIRVLNGSWRWSDGPDAPLASGHASPAALGQAVMLDGETFLAHGTRHGRATFALGPILEDTLGGVKPYAIENTPELQRIYCGAAAYSTGSQRRLLLVADDGTARLLQIDGRGRFQRDLGPSVLATTTPVVRWTSLAMSGTGALLAAADGAVIEMAPDGDHWKETRRWDRWGPEEHQRFGQQVHIATDAGRLWVADRMRHRVMVFSLGSAGPGARLAAFGVVDQPGCSPNDLDSPTTIAARGDRAVVFDAANQRLVKLRLR